MKKFALVCIFVNSLTLGATVLDGCGGSNPSTVAPTPIPPVPASIVVSPMDAVNETAMTGYFVDPFPVQSSDAASGAQITQTFTGTTDAILSCPGSSVTPNCFSQTTLTLSPGSLATALAAAGTTIKTYVAKSVYQDSTGAWHMVASAAINYVGTPSTPFWYTIIHMHSTNPSTPSVLPTSWSGDTLLVGSFSKSADANYAGHYFYDNGQLYLLYAARLATATGQDNGIVAQAMTSPTQLASSAPVILVEPNLINGGYNSEYYSGPTSVSNSLKLTETGNVTKINGKYVIAYSAAGYDTPYYKTGIAWCDTFLPPAGQTYTKVLKVDTTGVWGTPGNTEVEYLLQSEFPTTWPHYVGDQVIAPGVPSILQDNSGNWYLFFAGYDPTNDPLASGSTTNFNGAYRRPYYVPLAVNVPANTTVAATSPYNLESWITPGTEQ